MGLGGSWQHLLAQLRSMRELGVAKSRMAVLMCLSSFQL